VVLGAANVSHLPFCCSCHRERNIKYLGVLVYYHTFCQNASDRAGKRKCRKKIVKVEVEIKTR